MPNRDNDCYNRTAFTTAGMTVIGGCLGYFSGAVLPALTQVGQAHPIAQARTAAVGVGLLALIFTPAYMALVRNAAPRSSARGILQLIGSLAVMLLAYPTAQGVIPNEANKTNYNDTTANIALGILLGVVIQSVLYPICERSQELNPNEIIFADGNDLDENYPPTAANLPMFNNSVRNSPASKDKDKDIALKNIRDVTNIETEEKTTFCSKV